MNNYYSLVGEVGSRPFWPGVDQVSVDLFKKWFTRVFSKTHDGKSFCLLKNDKKFSIQKIKKCIEGGLEEFVNSAKPIDLEIHKQKKKDFMESAIFSSTEEDKEKFQEGVDRFSSRKQLSNLFFSEVLLEKKNYCSCIIKPDSVEDVLQKQHKDFIEKVENLGFTIVFNQIGWFCSIGSNKRGKIDAHYTYALSKKRKEIVDIFDSGCPSYYLLQHKDEGEVDKLIKASSGGKSKLGLPEIIMHSIKTDPLVIKNEVCLFLQKKKVLDQFIKNITH